MISIRTGKLEQSNSAKYIPSGNKVELRYLQIDPHFHHDPNTYLMESLSQEGLSQVGRGSALLPCSHLLPSTPASSPAMLWVLHFIGSTASLCQGQHNLSRAMFGQLHLNLVLFGEMQKIRAPASRTLPL